MIKMNLKYLGHSIATHPPKKIWLPKISNLVTSNQNVENSDFFVSRVNGWWWLLMTQLWRHSSSSHSHFSILDPFDDGIHRLFLGIFGCFRIRKNPSRGSIWLFRDPKHVGTQGSWEFQQRCGWSRSYYFLIRKVGQKFFKFQLGFFSFSKEENSKGDESNEDLEPIDLHRGPFFSTYLQWRVQFG